MFYIVMIIYVLFVFWCFSSPSQCVPKRPERPVCKNSNETIGMEWISVKNRLPDNDDTVLVSVLQDDFVRVKQVMIGVYNQRLWSTTNMENTYINTVTHWMPLPEPARIKLDKNGS